MKCSHVWPSKATEFDLFCFVILIWVNLQCIWFVFLPLGLNIRRFEDFVQHDASNGRSGIESLPERIFKRRVRTENQLIEYKLCRCKMWRHVIWDPGTLRLFHQQQTTGNPSMVQFSTFDFHCCNLQLLIVRNSRHDRNVTNKISREKYREKYWQLTGASPESISSMVAFYVLWLAVWVDVVYN